MYVTSPLVIDKYLIFSRGTLEELDLVCGCGMGHGSEWFRFVDHNGTVYKWDGDAIIGSECRSSLVTPGTT